MQNMYLSSKILLCPVNLLLHIGSAIRLPPYQIDAEIQASDFVRSTIDSFLSVKLTLKVGAWDLNWPARRQAVRIGIFLVP